MSTTGELKAIAEVKEDHKNALSAVVQEHKDIRRNYAGYHGQPGGIWSREDMAKIEDEGRPLLNINKIKPVIHSILGLELNNPLVMRVFAEQAESVVMAAALDALGNFHWHHLGGTDKRAEMFGAGVIAKRGHIILGLNTQNFIPELFMRAADGLDVLIDPGSVSYCPDDDADYMIAERWFTKDSLQNQNPGKARDIDSLLQRGQDTEYDLPFPMEAHKKLEWNPDYQADMVMRVDHHKNRIQVLEHWKRFTKTVWQLWDPQTGFMEDFDSQKDVNEALQAIFRESPELTSRMIQRKLSTRKMVRKVLAGGKIMLEMGDSPYPDELGFPISTFKAHHFGDMTTSVVDDLIDPARQHNVTWMNMLSIMQSVAHSGYWNPEQSGLTDEELEEDGSRTGMVKTYRYPFKPERIEPAGFQSMQAWDMGYTDEQIKEISGATEALRGIAPANIESGKGVDLLQRQGLAVLQILFSNLQRTERELYTKMLIMIQNFMPIPDEIEVMGSKLAQRLLSADPDIPMIQAGDQKFLRLGILGGINTMKSLKYKVRVQPGPATRNQREYWAQMALNLASQLPPGYFPPEALLELTDFPFTDEIIQHIQNVRELEATQAALAAGSDVANAASQGG